MLESYAVEFKLLIEIVWKWQCWLLVRVTILMQ